MTALLVCKPGDVVQVSGIYRVMHEEDHAQAHEVTCVKGRRLPPCNHCGHHLRFILVKPAHHVDGHEYFLQQVAPLYAPPRGDGERLVC
jgi:hypothetical protein